MPHLWEGLDRRSQQLLTRLRARVAAGQEPADQFKPTELEEWFAVSSTTAHGPLLGGVSVPIREYRPAGGPATDSLPALV